MGQNSLVNLATWLLVAISGKYHSVSMSAYRMFRYSFKEPESHPTDSFNSQLCNERGVRLSRDFYSLWYRYEGANRALPMSRWPPVK